MVVKAADRVAERRNRQRLAVAGEQAEGFEPGDAVIHLESNVAGKTLPQPRLDARVEARPRHGLAKQEEVGKESFLALLFLGGTDDGVEQAGVVVEIAE